MNQDPIWEAAMDWLFRLQAQPNDSALQAACDRWQAEHPDHQRAWKKVQRVWQLTGQLQVSERAPSPPTNTRRSNRLRLLAVAATLVLTTLLAHLLYNDQPAPSHTVVLEDGTRVTLDVGAKLSSTFSEQQRIVTLEVGTAFFDVARDVNRPFVVKAGSTEVEVLGTAFDVHQQADYFALSVAHGVVRVRDKTTDAPALDSPLHAGERVRLDRSSQSLTRDLVAPGQVAAWRDGLLLAQDDRLEHIVDELSRHHEGTILVLDSELRQQQVTGAFRLDQADQALEALVHPFGGKIKQYSPWLIVISR